MELTQVVCNLAQLAKLIFYLYFLWLTITPGLGRQSLGDFGLSKNGLNDIIIL